MHPAPFSMAQAILAIIACEEDRFEHARLGNWRYQAEEEESPGLDREHPPPAAPLVWLKDGMRTFRRNCQ
jgi:hypothetical protein